MASLSKLSVALPAQIADAISQAVESGEYTSNSEVVQEALREWKLRRPLGARDERRLQRLWGEGIASGPGRLQSIRAIKQEARRRAKSSKP